MKEVAGELQLGLSACVRPAAEKDAEIVVPRQEVPRSKTAKAPRAAPDAERELSGLRPAGVADPSGQGEQVPSNKAPRAPGSASAAERELRGVAEEVPSEAVRPVSGCEHAQGNAQLPPIGILPDASLELPPSGTRKQTL